MSPNDNKNWDLAVGTAKVVGGVGLVGLIAWKTPILALLQSFAWFVMLPIVFLGAIGVIGKGTVQAIGATLTPDNEPIMDRFTKKVRNYRNDLSDDDIERAIDN